MVTCWEIIVELKLPGLTQKIRDNLGNILWWPNGKQMFGSRFFSTADKDIAKRKGGKLEPGKFKSDSCYWEGWDH